eukprot:SAG31_NODE_6067_length_2185_cov_2.069990_2_plen_266_part_00
MLLLLLALLLAMVAQDHGHDDPSRPLPLTGVWTVPCPGGTVGNRTYPPNSFGACFTPPVPSVWIAFERPLSATPASVSARITQSNDGAPPRWVDGGPCCGDLLNAAASNISALGVTITVRSLGRGGWGEGLRVTWMAPGPPPPPAPPLAPPHLAYMAFYGHNRSAQCKWVNLMWQERWADGPNRSRPTLHFALTVRADIFVFSVVHTGPITKLNNSCYIQLYCPPSFWLLAGGTGGRCGANELRRAEPCGGAMSRRAQIWDTESL